ncbi:MAG: hypothetical protein PVJ57_08260 [Phycisphaerae bacterium]
MQELDFMGIERRAWQSVIENGLLDLALGVLLLWWGVIGLLARTDLSKPVMTAINLCGYAMLAATFFAARRRIAIPRAGQVRFGRRRMTRAAWAIGIVAVLVNVTFAVTLVAAARQRSLFGEALSPFVSPVLLGVFFLLLFGVPAFILDYRRLYVIAVMFALPEVVRTLCREAGGLDPGPLVFRAAGAAVVIAMGAVVLTRFLRSHPVIHEPKEPSEDDRRG